jgi:hypothetical protein
MATNVSRRPSPLWYMRNPFSACFPYFIWKDDTRFVGSCTCLPCNNFRSNSPVFVQLSTNVMPLEATTFVIFNTAISNAIVASVLTSDATLVFV